MEWDVRYVADTVCGCQHVCYSASSFGVPIVALLMSCGIWNAEQVSNSWDESRCNRSQEWTNEPSCKHFQRVLGVGDGQTSVVLGLAAIVSQQAFETGTRADSA